jgi:hypothetical protein
MDYKFHLTDSEDSKSRVYSQFYPDADGECDIPAIFVETAIRAVRSFYNLLSLNARQNVEQVRCRHYRFIK